MGASAIILAGGSSARLGQDKGLVPLGEKPLVKHVLDTTTDLVDEKIVVVSSASQARNYAQELESSIKIIVDTDNLQAPLIGALTGFETAHGDYSLLLPCDVPYVSKKILSLLIELSVNKAAVIPRWPNGNVEPLQAVYHTKSALEAAKGALNDGKLNLEAMIGRLHGVRYVSTLVLQQLDAELATFLNINTPMDLKKAETMLKRPRFY